MSLAALDRPVWNSLSGRLAAIAPGDAAVRRLDPRHGPFAGARDAGEQAQTALGALVRRHGLAVLIEAEAWPAPPGCTAELEIALAQMVAGEGLATGPVPAGTVPLGEGDAAEMGELVALTEPGPWAELTHRIGRFYGVRREGRLVAMAGERMLPAPDLAEVSAVCTHPDARGQGLAGGLVRHVTAGMIARGERPFLHVDAEKTGTIRLYEGLGFQVRRMMVATILVAD